MKKTETFQEYEARISGGEMEFEHLDFSVIESEWSREDLNEHDLKDCFATSLEYERLDEQTKKESGFMNEYKSLIQERPKEKRKDLYYELMDRMRIKYIRKHLNPNYKY